MQTSTGKQLIVDEGTALGRKDGEAKIRRDRNPTAKGPGAVSGDEAQMCVDQTDGARRSFGQIKSLALVWMTSLVMLCALLEVEAVALVAKAAGYPNRLVLLGSRNLMRDRFCCQIPYIASFVSQNREPRPPTRYFGDCPLLSATIITSSYHYGKR